MAVACTAAMRLRSCDTARHRARHRHTARRASREIRASREELCQEGLAEIRRAATRTACRVVARIEKNAAQGPGPSRDGCAGREGGWAVRLARRGNGHSRARSRTWRRGGGDVAGLGRGVRAWRRNFVRLLWSPHLLLAAHPQLTSPIWNTFNRFTDVPQDILCVL